MCIFRTWQRISFCGSRPAGADNNIHAHLGSRTLASGQRCAITQVKQGKPGQIAKFLFQGQQIGEDLTGIGQIGEPLITGMEAWLAGSTTSCWE